MKPTILKIAELAGVSRGTVDRALNNKVGVRDEVKERVLKIANDLNYTPNKLAKALVMKKKTTTLFVILPPKESIFFNEVLIGVEFAQKELIDYGVSIKVFYTDNKNPNGALNILNQSISDDVNGIVISAMDLPEIRNKINELNLLNIPVLTINSDISNCKRLCYVGQDIYKSGIVAGGLMDKILLDNSNILILTGNMKYKAHILRVEGFVNRLKKSKKNLNVVKIIEGYDNYSDCYSNMITYLQHSPSIDGLFLATGPIDAAIDALNKYNLNRKVKIITNDFYGNTEKYLKEGIIDFTILQEPFNQGYNAVKILFNYLFFSKLPEEEYIFTETIIKIAEN